MSKNILFSLFLCLSFTAFSSQADNRDSDDSWLYKPAPLALQVIDSFLELHTGPGRGYPVFFVIEQGEQIEVLTRRPDWYEVRSKDNKVGWVKASQLARTLQSGGEPADLPSVSYSDYVKNRWRVSVAAGQLNGDELKGAETYSVGFGYFPWSFIGAEIEAGQFYGDDVRGTLYGANLVFEPITLIEQLSEWRISPALVYGQGTTQIDVQPLLVPLDFEKEKHQLLGFRLNYYAGRNFIVKAEYRSFELSGVSEEFNIWHLGFSTFF